MNKSSQLISDGKVKLIFKDKNKKSFEVGKHHVTIRKMPGRQEAGCDCIGISKFPHSICSHKAAAITYDTMRRIRYEN